MWPPLAPGAASVAAISASDCSTAQLSGVMAVYLAAPPGRATPAPAPAGETSYLVSVLRGRLRACRSQLGWSAAHAPPPGSRARACWPVEREEGDVPRLWSELSFCEQLVRATADPPAAQWSVPARSGEGLEHLIFVVGLGGDEAMRAKLISTLTTYLNQAGSARWYHFVDDATFVAEPAWQASDYAQICSSSASVEGTLLLQIAAAGSGASDRFFSRRNWSAFDATAFYERCAGGLSHRSAEFVWASDIVPQEGHANTLTLLTPLALLLTIGSTYEIFAPAQTHSVTSTRAFANPSASPPPSGRQTQVTTTNSTAYNAASLAGLSTSFLSSSINYTNSVTSPSQFPTVDELTWDTLGALAIKLMTQMNCWTPGPLPAGAGRLRNVVGSQRSLPAYNAPPGLASYSAGRPSAPFCAEPSGSQSVREMLAP
ncbi:MAG: hypothetical protein ACREMP_05790 [Candidatus Tyrphobacter sp.]